jgi:hypothetical protein
MRQRLALLLVGALLLGAVAARRGPAGEAAAQGGTEINWWVVAGGGGPSAATGVTMNDTLGQAVAGEAAGGTVSLSAGYWYPGFGPTAVLLVSFDAAPSGAAILVTWESSQEIENLGFNLYRAESEAGPMARLNDELIPSGVPPGSPFGTVYEWLDEDGLVPGQVYYYWLEDVDIYGRTTLHGPVQATPGLWMHVGPIDMSCRASRNKFTVSARTEILDGAGIGVAEATVTIRWTLPDQSTADQQAPSNGKGAVSFKITGTQAGTYQFCVMDVVKPGWVYDPAANTETCDTLAVP